MENKVPDNKTGVPLAHYKTLYAEADPLEMSARTGIKWDAEKGEFRFTVLSTELKATWPELGVYYAESGEACKPSIVILFARFLMEGTTIVSAGKFLAYAEMPWGQVYNSNFNGRCTRRLAGTFGTDLPGFERACVRLGGVKAGMGDVSYDLTFLPGLVLRVILWEGDDEYPASCQILFSDNFPAAFTAEDDCVVCETAIAFLNAARKE